jgi:hypothetical protein
VAVNRDISASFREIRSTLEPLRARSQAARSALDLLERDLLPRSAGADAYLVVGIVGPNNAGKSALFNSLVGRDLSPSMPTGGATRRLVGALHPDLLQRLQNEPTLARFRLRKVDGARAEQATEQTGDPAEVLVATDGALPAHVMLIDTPDFDSILDDNRIASESLLAVADLVIAVVTRHSYQNRAVVDFLEGWLAHGRPWVLVYNEALDHATASAHSAKLAADVGTPPLGSYWAAHDLQVQTGEKPLSPRGLDDGERPLRDLLFDLSEIAEVKARAFAAAQARLHESMAAVAQSLRAQVSDAQTILQAAGDAARRAGLRVASSAMPSGPFVEAFRNVLDRRTNFLSRGWRQTLRQVRIGIESLPSALLGRSRASDDSEELRLEKIETDALRTVWPTFWEELVRDIGPEARHAARARASAEIAAVLDRDLGTPGRGTAARADAERALRATPAAEIGTFRLECEKLVERALDERGFDIDIQAAADVATLAPLALAAAVIINTAGLGSDVAAAGSGAVSTFLVEKYYHLLGRGVMAEAQRRWTQLRGEQLSDVLLQAALPTAGAALRSSVDDDARMAGEIDALRASVDLAGDVPARRDGARRSGGA